MNGTIPVTAAEIPAQQTPAATVDKPQGFGPVAGVSKDRDGRTFDPAKFLPEKDGNGRWKRIGGPGKPGRPPGSKNRPKAPESAPQQPAPDFSDVKSVIDAATAPTPPPSAAAAAPAGDAFPVLQEDTESTTTSETIIGILQMVLVMVGDEEGYLTPTEKRLLDRAITRVLKKYEVADDFMPEEIELVVLLGGMVVDRIRKGGKTATAFEKGKAWVINLIFRGKGILLGREARREVPEPLVDKLAARVNELEEQLRQKMAAAQSAAAQPAQVVNFVP